MSPDLIYIIVILIFSVIVHEVMHGVAADWLGDKTARYAGRLTLNPIPHIDLLGSIIVPVLASFTGYFFGWAKPVPVNPYNFRILREWGEAITAFAGPLSNLVLALIFGLLVRFDAIPMLSSAFFYVVVINCSLFLLNMIPIPPLDGSKVLAAFLPYPLSAGYDRLRDVLESNFIISLILILVLVNTVGSAFGALVFDFARLIAGV